MKFQAEIIPSGNATAVEVPEEIIRSFESGPRPPVVVTINRHTWRSRIALMRGQRLIGISAANRASSGTAAGDVVEVDVELDTEARSVSEPSDLARALDQDERARASFERLPFGLKKKHVAGIEESKSPEVRQRRIAKLIERMKAPS